MSVRLRGYGLALACVLVTAGIRFSLIPVLGNRFGFDLFLLSTFICGRYFGFGPSVFALVAGAFPVSTFHFAGSDLHDPYFGVGLLAYFILGAIVVLLCKSEQDIRSALEQEIADRRKTLEALEAEQELLCHTIEVQDRERQLIVYEIHDGVLQYATGALMQLEAMVRGQSHATAVTERVEHIVGVLAKAVSEGRRLMNGIRPPVLDESGIIAAVQQLLEEEDRAHVHVEFVKDAGLGRMPSQIEEALYRITQEALTNIKRHSQSKKVRVEITRIGDRVRLNVRDWGVGFTPSGGFKTVHGIKGMTERARIAGGRCTIESAPGEGTQIFVDLPYLRRDDGADDDDL